MLKRLTKSKRFRYQVMMECKVFIASALFDIRLRFSEREREKAEYQEFPCFTNHILRTTGLLLLKK